MELSSMGHEMTDNVRRFSDYERRSREPDSVSPRDPADADVIELQTPAQRRGLDAATDLNVTMLEVAGGFLVAQGQLLLSCASLLAATLRLQRALGKIDPGK